VQKTKVTPDTLFHVASVTKTIVATAVAQLAEAGKLGLDEPVNRYLDRPVFNPHHPQSPITVRQLLTHTSSISDAHYYEIDFRLRDGGIPAPLDAFIDSYLRPGGGDYSPESCFSAAAPGEAYDYSNVGFALLGLIGGRIVGTDFRKWINAHLFRPLGMRNYAWRPMDWAARPIATPYDADNGTLKAVDPVTFPDWPAGMLRISVNSFMPFLAASANQGATLDTRMLSAASQQQMLKIEHPTGLPAWISGQGLGWMASPEGGRDWINHWGGDPGVFTMAYIDPVARSGVALFANTSATKESKTAMKAIIHLLFQDHA
jgi:CubicO group peptidase (beta-lactamase class C family)